MLGGSAVTAWCRPGCGASPFAGSSAACAAARASGPGPALLEGDLEDISAEERVLLHLEHVDVGTALARISPELRVVLQLTVLDGLNTAEAAALLGIPRGTVKSRLQRARATMREEMA